MSPALLFRSCEQLLAITYYCPFSLQKNYFLHEKKSVMIYSKYLENASWIAIKQVMHFKNAFTQTAIKLLEVIESLGCYSFHSMSHLICIKLKAAHQQSPKKWHASYSKQITLGRIVAANCCQPEHPVSFIRLIQLYPWTHFPAKGCT